MQLRLADPPVRQADRSNSFHLPPSTPPVELPQPRQLPNGSSYGDGLDFAEWSNDLEVHSLSLPLSTVLQRGPEDLPPLIPNCNLHLVEGPGT